jgi:hypothetical protein
MNSSAFHVSWQSCSECTVRFLPLDVPLSLPNLSYSACLRSFRGASMQGPRHERVTVNIGCGNPKTFASIQRHNIVILEVAARLHSPQLLFVLCRLVLLRNLIVRFLMDVREAYPQPLQRAGS